MNTKQIRIRLEPEEIARLDELAGEYHMQHGSALASILLKAGIKAIEANGGRLSLPPTFEIITGGGAGEYRLNEPKPASKGRK